MPPGEGFWSYPHPSLPSCLSQAVSRDCFGFCQQLGFSDPKPGLALLPASKLMPLNDASLSPGLGTSRHGGPSDRDPTHPLLGLMLGARDVSGTHCGIFMAVNGDLTSNSASRVFFPDFPTPQAGKSTPGESELPGWGSGLGRRGQARPS